MQKSLSLLVLLFAILATVAVPQTVNAQEPEDNCMIEFDLCERANAHEERVRELAEVFSDEGFQSWLKTAGYEYDQVRRAARQPEELTFLTPDDHDDIVVAGFQIRAANLSVEWPAGMTTDRQVDGLCYQPDEDNESRVCTNVVSFTGPATLWVSVIEWSQLDPELTETDEIVSETCLTLAELGQLGDIVTELESGGELAGSQISFETDWVAPEGWIIQISGTEREFARSGDVATVWSPEECRPLGR